METYICLPKGESQNYILISIYFRYDAILLYVSDEIFERSLNEGINILLHHESFRTELVRKQIRG